MKFDYCERNNSIRATMPDGRMTDFCVPRPLSAEIVRRVNAHEALVAALEDLVDGHSMRGEEAGRAALSAAKGGAA